MILACPGRPRAGPRACRVVVPPRGGQESFVRPVLHDASPCGTVAVMKQHVIDEVLARQVASAVLADVRTVRHVLRGESVRGVVGARIRAELTRRLTLDLEAEARPVPGPTQPDKES